MAHADLWQRLIEKWQADTPQPRLGVPDPDIAAFERRTGVVMPADMRAYFAAGDDQEEMGDDCFRFWPLSEVKPVHDELCAVDAHGRDIHPDRFDYPGYFVFANYLIWAWGYAVHMTNDPNSPGPVVCLDGVHNRQVAESFAVFIEKYMADPNSVMP